MPFFAVAAVVVVIEVFAASAAAVGAIAIFAPLNVFKRDHLTCCGVSPRRSGRCSPPRRY